MFFDQALVYAAIQRGESFTFVDGKGDPHMAGQIDRLIRRRSLRDAEYRRRGVKFLPKQVMAPLYERAGLQSPRTTR